VHSVTDTRRRTGSVKDFPSARAAELAVEVGAEFSERLGDVVYALQTEPEPAFIYISPSVLQLSGYTDEEHYADPSIAIESTDPRDRPKLVEAFAAEPGVVQEFVVRWIRRDRHIIWTHHRSRKHVQEDGTVVIYAAARDVTAQVKAEAGLSASEERYRLLAENASDVVWRTDHSAVLEWVSPSVEAVLGWRQYEMVGRRIIDLVHPDDMEQVVNAGSEVNEGERVSFEARYLTKDGAHRWLEVTARPVMDAEGVIVGRVGSCRDVHSEVEAWQAMERSESRFRLAMESAPTGMALMDLDRRFVEVNPALCRMLAYDAPHLIGRRMVDILNATDDEVDLRMRDELLSGSTNSATHEIRLIRTDGVVVWVQHAIGLLRDEDGVPQSYVSQFVNVTEAREAREALHFMATHDPLTQLLNRRELLARMSKVLAHAPRSGNRLAVLFADLDGLKSVNDSFGHAVGDEVITEVARRVASLVREDDLAARIGGDEFVIVLPAVSGEDGAQAVARKVQEAICQPLLVEGYPVPVGVSIGIALAATGEDPQSVIRNADSALYLAKQKGGNRIELFDLGATTEG
jgi:diguanylate cyclase (GGDEF)-like protein/PAS domain S-box-containing protein